MNQSFHRHLSLVLKRRLDIEAQRWIGTLESGFDVAVVIREKTLFDLVKEHLRPSLRRRFDLKSQSVESTSDERLNQHAPVTFNLTRLNGESTKIRLTLYCRPPLVGFAAIPFELPPLEELLPSPSAMVSQVLASSQLDRFTEAFDGKKMSLLRKILEFCGPESFFDAIVQVAYLAGYRGEDEAADALLGSILAQATTKPNRTVNSETALTRTAPQESFDLGAVFEKFLNLPDPHDVLKAALAHYVFHGRKVTQSEASRILNVSRSTLQAHLQLAERLKVAELFIY